MQQSPHSSSFKPSPIHRLQRCGGSGVNTQYLDEADIVETGQHFDEDDSPVDARPMTKEQPRWLNSD
ncbi:hypothetical protein BYT27DRAFT_7184539 [Phlegmacium glaucopus]|nr:hypothetical protein BYT27DRAFT_7184539 [Phlegmacium glaucopus]